MIAAFFRDDGLLSVSRTALLIGDINKPWFDDHHSKAPIKRHISQLSILPQRIGHLTALTRIHLNGSELSLLPGEIGRLTALTEFEVAHNQLSMLPLEIGELTSLTQLSLDHSKLNTLPAEIGQLKASGR